MRNHSYDTVICPSSTCIGCATRCHRQQKNPYSRDEALAILFEHVEFHLETESIPLREALNRVTAEQTYATFPVPTANTAQHDGIAVCWEHVKQTIEKGCHQLTEREFRIRSMGSAIEPPFDTLIPSEQVNYLQEGKVEIKALPSKGQGVYRRGSNIQEGERIVPANYRLNPANLLILRYAGVETIPVWKKPKAAVIPIGSDLVAAGCVPGPGQVVEADSILLESIVRECGGEAWTETAAADSVEDICQAMLHVIDQCDFLILIGGLGKSGAQYQDYTAQAVAKLGKVLAHGMGFGPGGMAMLLGEMQGKCVVGIPAPPHAALTQSEQYLPAIMERFLHCPCYERQEIKAKLHADYKSGKKSGYHPHVDLKRTDDGYEIVPVKMGDTVDCFVNATGILMEESQDRLMKRGELATVQLLCGERTIQHRHRHST